MSITPEIIADLVEKVRFGIKPILQIIPSDSSLELLNNWYFDVNKWQIFTQLQLGKKHIMLSYNWGVQDLVRTSYEYLESRGVPVWMDIKGGMSGEFWSEVFCGGFVVLLLLLKMFLIILIDPF